MLMFTDVSGSCLESVVSYMYSGILRLTPDTVNVLLVVAMQLEISSLIELCQNFIANPRHPEPSGEKKQTGCNSVDSAKDHSVDEITCLHKPTVKLETENSVNDSVTTLPVCPSAEAARSTRSFSRKLQKSESSKSSHVVKLSTASNREQPACRKDRNSLLETSVESCEPKRLVSATSTSSVKDDPDWKPTMDSCSRSAVHRYNTRKHSRPTVDKPLSSSDVSVRNVRRKHMSSSSHAAHLARTHAALATTNQTTTAAAAVRNLPAWQQSRRILLAARVFLAKQIKVSDDGLLHCRQCQVEAVASRSRLAAHILRRHKRWLWCFSCHQLFSSFLAMVRHRYRKHYYTRYASSPICKKVTVSSRSGPSTALSLHNKCGWCGLKFAARSKLIEHRETVHRKRTDSALTRVCRRVVRDWSCSEKDCGMEFKQKDKLRLHMAEHHPTVIFSCPECRFKTQVEHILRR